jgi:hypothetical protein
MHRLCYYLCQLSHFLVFQTSNRNNPQHKRGRNIAMSKVAPDLIPRWDLLLEFSSTTKLIVGDTITHLTIFEENKGSLDLANAPKLQPRTKHIGIKYHHFFLMFPMVPSSLNGLVQNINWQIYLPNHCLLLVLSIFALCFSVGNLVIRGSVGILTYTYMISSVTPTATTPRIEILSFVSLASFV